MSGNVKLITPSNGSVTLSTPDTASAVTVTIPAATDTVTLNVQAQTLTNKTLTAAGSNSVEATSGPTQTQLSGNRNKIINGAMMIDQRNAGASVTVTGIYSGFPVDRFKVTSNTTGSLSFQQSTDAPSGFINSLKATVTASDSSPPVGVWLEHDVEGLNCADLAFGSANAATITISFRVKSSLTGTFGASVENSANNRSYPFSYVINSANTWEQKSVTISGDTSGTWLTTNGIGLRLIFDLGLTGSLRGPAGAWASADYRGVTGATSVVGTNGATFYITGVQLEAGATATPFENRLYGEELMLCQRYYEKSYDIGVAPGSNSSPGTLDQRCTSQAGGSAGMSVPLKVEKRTAPTITFYQSNGTINSFGYGTSATGYTTGTPSAADIASSGFRINISVGSNWVAAEVYGHFTASAEL